MGAAAATTDSLKGSKLKSEESNVVKRQPKKTSTKQLVFTADGDSLSLIDSLKIDLGASTTAAVIRKSLTIARLAADQAKDSNGIVLFRGREQPKEDGVLVSLKT